MFRGILACTSLASLTACAADQPEFGNLEDANRIAALCMSSPECGLTPSVKKGERVKWRTATKEHPEGDPRTEHEDTP